MSDYTDAEVFRDAVAHMAGGKATGKNAYAVVPDGYRIEPLEDLQPEPNRVRAKWVFRDTKSLAAYCGNFPEATPIAFADPNKRSVRVVMDHSMGVRTFHHDHEPSFLAVYPPEYAAWAALDCKGMSQIDAGLFLEDRAADVIEPDAATIMDTVLGFDALKKVTFKSSQRLHDGQRQFIYSEENQAAGKVKLPERITLLLPVFEGQEPERILIRVRYRINDGHLRFQFDIADRVRLERTAFERAVDAFQNDMPSLLITKLA